MIHIDIRDMLKESSVATALPYVGQCFYSAPCIVGTAVPETQRAFLDNWLDPTTKSDQQEIKGLIENNVVTCPDGQRDDIQKLQSAFDSADEKYFRRVVDDLRAKYGVQA